MFQQPSLPTLDENQLNPAGNSWPSRLPLKAFGQLEDGYEIMRSIGPKMSNATNPSVLVVKEAGSPALRGTVNLILNLSKTGDSLVQVPDQPAQAGGLLDQTAEPVHRVRNVLVLIPTVTKRRSAVAPHDLILCCTRFRSLAFTFSPPPPFLSPSAHCASFFCL